MTVREMALRLGRSVGEVRKDLAGMGLGWVRGREGLSRGQAALTNIIERLLPGEKVEIEYPIGERLKLDVFCPKVRLAAEYHGQQHFVFIEHFHRDMDGFHDSQRRDIRKAQLCQEKGITLVVFCAQNPMTQEFVFNSLMQALSEGPATPGRERKVKEKTAYQLEAAARQREYRKRVYQIRKKERKL
jgi:hypothetical protein